MRAGVVDIGTNSMRLLITDGVQEVGRWVEVTGLGRGVDVTGRLGDEAVERTIEVLGRFGGMMDRERVDARAAIATSASRDAANSGEFLDRAGSMLGVRPDVISGDREGELAYAGATAGLDCVGHVVSDIGGGSTEFVTAGATVSIDIGSVRLTDRVLSGRPASPEQMELAMAQVEDLFSGLALDGGLIGVAGTWTSLAAIDLGLPAYDRERVHHHRMKREALHETLQHLATLTVEETEQIPSLDPARAPVILAGAVIADKVMAAVGADTVLVSESDSLDGLAAELLGLT